MRIRFWGTRGSIAAPGKDTIYYGGNTTCVEVMLESGSRLIIDAGTGLRAMGDHLVKQGQAVHVNLLITHIHWDHVSGFPFFGPVHDADTRITVDGFPSCMKGLRLLFDNKMSDGFFPVKFEDLKAEIRYRNEINQGPIQIDDVVIDAIPLHHPQGGFGYRFREKQKIFVFLTDHEITKEPMGGRDYESYVSFCRNADVVVLDAQYTLEEVKERRGWGHSDYISALELAAASKAKKLILFHHDPSRIDAEIHSIVTRCRKIAAEKQVVVEINAAREGSEIII